MSRILVLSAVFPPNIVGGAEVSTFNLADSLSKFHDISVVTMAEDNEVEVWDERLNDLHLYRLKFPRVKTTYAAHKSPMSPFEWKVWHLQDFLDTRMLSKFKRVLSRVKPDFVFVHLLDGIGFNVLPLIEKSGSKVIFFLHDLSLVCTNASMFKDGKNCIGQCGKCKVVTLAKGFFIDKLSDYFFASPSNSNLNTVRKYLPQSSGREGLVVRNILDDVSELPEHRPTDDGLIRIMYAGRIHPTKGLDLLLKALKPLAHRFKFILSIYGRGEQEAELRELYGDEAWVDFKGFVDKDEVARSILLHDLVCTPSLWAEVYGRVTAQALSYGIPVIGSSTGGTAELIRDGITGLLLPAGDVELWRQAFERIFSNPELISQWRRNAISLASEFDRSKIIEQVLAFIEGHNDRM